MSAKPPKEECWDSDCFECKEQETCEFWNEGWDELEAAMGNMVDVREAAVEADKWLKGNK